MHEFNNYEISNRARFFYFLNFLTSFFCKKVMWFFESSRTRYVLITNLKVNGKKKYGIGLIDCSTRFCFCVRITVSW